MSEPGSDVLVEINEGGDYEKPMPAEIVARLMRLGWQAPQGPLRNCWTGVGRPEGDNGPPRPDWFTDAADRIVAGVLDLCTPRRKGSSSRRMRERADGGLVIAGHDLGPDVQRVFGFDEYEFHRTVDPAGVRQLRLAAGLGDGPLVPALEERFAGTRAVEVFLAAQGIPTKFWSRIGDSVRGARPGN